MKQELKEILNSLREWSKKYNKNYVTIYVLNGSVSANVDPKDKDHEYLDLFFRKEDDIKWK